MYIRSIVLLVIVTLAFASSTYSNSTVTSMIFSVASLSIEQDSASPHYPKDFYVSQVVGKTKLYTLGSNNIVQIYAKQNLCSPIQIFEDYSYRYNPSYSFVYMSINELQDTLVLTSFTSLGLKHITFSLGLGGIESLRNETNLQAQSTSPRSVFMRNSLVYSYFRGENNDYIWVIDIASQYNYTIVLSTSLGEFVLAPNRERAVVWNNRSTLYIYSVANNFSLEYIYNASAGSPTNKTGYVSFSSNSELILLETDNTNPVRVINVSDFSTIHNITATGIIYNVVFLDNDCRFILVETATGAYLYDMTNTQSELLNNSFFRKYLISDSSGNQLFDISTSNIQAYGINITSGNTTIIKYTAEICLPSSTSTPPNANNTGIDPGNFYTVIHYSSAEAEAISQIGGRIEDLSVIIENMFSIIFSTPLAIYFFSIFNYFTLSSFYVYLDIRIPQLVFNYLSIITESAQSDILAQLGIQVQVKPISVERVSDARMLYFGVSSDLFTTNLVNFIIVTANILFYEFVLFIVGKHCLRKKRPYTFLLGQRIDIYWGLLVSNIVPLILPWKYAIFGGSTEFPSKMTLGAQYLVLCVIPFLLIVSLLNEFRKAKKKEGKSRVKEALLEWWNSYQNFIYPLLLLRNPIYFLVVVGLGNLFVFYSSFQAQGWRSLAILKSCYPLLFHSCFVIFMTSKDQNVLVYTSIVCLAVFLMGSIHHLLETIITSLKWFAQSVKKACLYSKVAPTAKTQPMKVQKEGQNQKKLTEQRKKQRNSQSAQAHSRLKVNFQEADSLKSSTLKTVSFPNTIFQASYTTKIKMTRDNPNINKNTLIVKQNKLKTTLKK